MQNMSISRRRAFPRSSDGGPTESHIPSKQPGLPPFLHAEESGALTGWQDVLSDVLDGLYLRSWVTSRSTHTAPWGVRVDGTVPPGFYAITSGRAWLVVDGADSGRWLETGDLVVLAHGGAHSLSCAPGAQLTPIESLLTPEMVRSRRGMVQSGGGALTTFAGGCFIFDDRGFSPLASGLPAILHVPGHEGRPQAWVEDVLRMLEREVRENRPGAQTVINRIAQVIYLNAVRDHVDSARAGDVGWIPSLLSPDLGPALSKMHMQPEVSWTVASLARKAGMSRSVFAKRFAEGIGMTPARYLLECRMRRAQSLLRDGSFGMKEIATRVGYGSESAFSSAFKRWNGSSPSAFRTSGDETKAPAAEKRAG